MITRKDLKDRLYVAEKCVGFTIYAQIGDNEKEVTFRKSKDGCWGIFLYLDRDDIKDGEAYHVKYKLPTDSINLEMVAAIGIRYLQLKMKEEVQKKSEMDFQFGEMLVGMIGDPL